MKIYQSAVTDDPVLPQEIATKRYVDQQIVSGSAIVGGVFITDITPTGSGIVGAKQFVPNTIPANRVVTSGTADTSSVRVSFVAEGGSAFYSPVVTITTEPPQPGGPITGTLNEDQYDKRMFSGYADIQVPVTTVVTVRSNTNATATATVNVAEAGPTTSTVTIGALPGTQTEVKNNDVLPITGIVGNSATYAEVLATGASKAVSSLTLGAADSGGQGFKTVSGTFTVGAGAGAQRASIRARNALGTYGITTQSTNTVTLNQTFPAISARTVTYPAGQSALKGNETATVSATITNADRVTYTATSPELSIADREVYSVAKTVTRVSGGYVVGSPNYSITATKTSNAATTTATAAVSIADTAPTASIAIVGNPARLTSTPEGRDYVVRVTPNQLLNGNPVLAASSGTWQGAWSFSGGVYSRTLRINDADVDGAQTFNGMVLTNIANVDGNTISAGANYVVGGFVRRTLTFAPFQQTAPIGTNIQDFSKVVAKYAGSSDLTRRTDTSQFFAGFTITNADGTYNPNGGYMFLTDAEFAGSNTTGTLQVEIEEVA